MSTTIVPDAATCEDCLDEIFNPADRRFQYPFTNCTNCGPRLTITHCLPYDRANTSMAAFPMCSACSREYEDPANRRFHALPNACVQCGPQIWLCDKKGKRIDPPEKTSMLSYATELIGAGQILAIKGLGGFHLACDGSNQQAVATLRQRKGRYGKPLALMVRDLPMAELYVYLDQTARILLTSPQAPIVLGKKTGRAGRFPRHWLLVKTSLALCCPIHLCIIC